MFSLQDLLGPEKGEAAVGEISAGTGVESSVVNSVVQAALPQILGGLASNASTPDGAESLNNALERHDGSLLDNLGGLATSVLGGGSPPPQADGGGILGHIFGGSEDSVAQDVGQKTGVGSGQVMQILMMLAPIVMSYLGRQKQQSGAGADGLSGILGGLLGGANAGAGGGLSGIAGAMLDRDHDGSAADDIASAAFNYLKNR
jgi:hypothetical protein